MKFVTDRFCYTLLCGARGWWLSAKNATRPVVHTEESGGRPWESITLEGQLVQLNVHIICCPALLMCSNHHSNSAMTLSYEQHRAFCEKNLCEIWIRVLAHRI